MHHLKETTIDGVKFVLIPEELHDKLVRICHPCYSPGEFDWAMVCDDWEAYDPEIFSDGK